MSRASLLFSAIAAPAAFSFAQAAQADPAPATMDQSEVRICRVEPMTGTRLGAARACHTEAEWAEQRRQAIQNVNRIQNSRAWNATQCPTSLKPGC